MSYKVWKWIYDYSRKKLIDNYAARKCENCGRWDCEAPIIIVSDTVDRMFQETLCTGCGKITNWFMGAMAPVWASRIVNKKKA